MNTDKLFEKAMKEAKTTGKKMLDFSRKECIKHRLAIGMDEGGHPIKGYDPETGEKKIPKKRGRKPKSETVVYTAPVEEVTPKSKNKKSSIKKKEKSGKRGRVPAVPSLDFNNKTFEEKKEMFDKAMKEFFGEKYDGRTLTNDKEIIEVNKILSSKGAFVVEFKTETTGTKFYEYVALKKLYMSKIAKYSYYMEPLKK